jgi:hypothetical protein
MWLAGVRNKARELRNSECNVGSSPRCKIEKTANHTTEKFLVSVIDSVWLILDSETRCDGLVHTIASGKTEFFQTGKNIMLLINCHCSFGTILLNPIAKIHFHVIIRF